VARKQPPDWATLERQWTQIIYVYVVAFAIGVALTTWAITGVAVADRGLVECGGVLIVGGAVSVFFLWVVPQWVYTSAHAQEDRLEARPQVRED